ncbi:hypothetical protein ACNF49_40895 [Actinomadura sp. ATCC 39365]
MTTIVAIVMVATVVAATGFIVVRLCWERIRRYQPPSTEEQISHRELGKGRQAAHHRVAADLDGDPGAARRRAGSGCPRGRSADHSRPGRAGISQQDTRNSS